MKGLKLTTAVLLAGGILCSHPAQANDTVVFAGAGASALYNGLEQGALSAFSVTAASNSVIANNSASVVDTTSGSTVTNAGNAWVVWDSAPAGSRRIAYYVSIDATVGVRAFFNRDTVTFTSAFLASLPADVAAAVQAAPSSPSAGNTINVAGASIRVEDSLIATARTWSFGYTIANPIKDSGGQTSIPIAFNPASRPYITTSIGASPLIIFVNTSTSGGTNTPVLGSVNNINSLNLVSLYANLVPSYDTGVLGAAPGKPLTIFLHDPLSGNHSTLEFEEPGSQQYSTSQENGIDPIYSNPLNEAGIPLSDGVSPPSGD